MRIILDTNVVMSALPEELADVLTQPSVTQRLAFIGKAVHEVLTDYIKAIELDELAIEPRVVPSNADDDHVIAASVAAGATLIVSGDSDLLIMGSHQGIDIISAAVVRKTNAPSQPMA